MAKFKRSGATITITGWIVVNNKGRPTTVNEGECGDLFLQSSTERGCFDIHNTKRFALGYAPKRLNLTVRKVTLTFKE